MDDTLIARAGSELLRYRTHPEATCKICGSTAMPFDMVDLLKQCEAPFYPATPSLIPVIYHRCANCGFIFTTYFDEFSGEMWCKHIYNSDYIKVDPEYLNARPKRNSFFIDTLLSTKKSSVIGIDYGGGNGVTAETLRGLGYEYDSYDPYGTSSMDKNKIGSYNFCSAIEVLEHASDPVGLMTDLVGLAKHERLIVLIGTCTSDRAVTNSQRLSWWYAAPRNGHISLFSEKSLSILAKRFSLVCHSFSQSIHIFTRNLSDKEISYFWFRGRIYRKIKAIRNKLIGQ
ncbi:MAG: class I SAM-dependent methyltransferase [Planctomycetia bacterium]|nr:class I SAM-dependent methyltransferase [Planctomycetia bacterium]